MSGFVPGSFPEKPKMRKLLKNPGQLAAVLLRKGVSEPQSHENEHCFSVPSSPLTLPYKTVRDAGYFRENFLHFLISFSVIG